MDENTETPDLASVLRTLASLAPKPPAVPVPNQSTIPGLGQLSPRTASRPQQPTLYDPFAVNLPEKHSATPPVSPPRKRLDRHGPDSQSYHYGEAPPQQYSLPKPSYEGLGSIDATTIIEWGAGLRCVMRTISTNEDSLQKIKELIRVQHRHEEEWWAGRNGLLTRLADRKEGKKKLDDVLRAVGGRVSEGNLSEDSPEALAKELETYDMKVYKAQLQMVRETSSRLKDIGVPFFGTRTELVRRSGAPLAGTAGKPMIDESELVKLQRKMLETLEDACSD